MTCSFDTREAKESTMHMTSQEAADALSTHCCAIGLALRYPRLRLTNVAALAFASITLAAMESPMPIQRARVAGIIESSAYMEKADGPTKRGRDLLIMNRGFIPRGTLPTQNVAPQEQILHVGISARATPPPISLPCATAAVSTDTFLRDRAT
jgi:hypothetical protein